MADRANLNEDSGRYTKEQGIHDTNRRTEHPVSINKVKIYRRIRTVYTIANTEWWCRALRGCSQGEGTCDAIKLKVTFFSLA
jgi:hypothetical protein